MTHISGYVQALIFAMFFLVFINGDIGRALVQTILLAVVISAVMLFFSRKRFTVKLREMSGVTECGRSVEFEVTLAKKGFCFIPYAEVCVDAEQSIRLRTSLLFRKSATVKGSFRTTHCGLTKVRVESVLIGDLMGNMRHNIKVEQETVVAVLPRMIEYSGPEIKPNLLPSEEDVEEGTTVLRGGMPGYEHREYVPGDSPRRVNYKLSAKRHRLMVRLDESNGNATTNLYLAKNARPVCCDKAFALASKLILRGGTVKITHKDESRTASTPETLDRMREWLAFREFCAPGEVVVNDDPPEDTAAVFSGEGDIIVMAV